MARAEPPEDATKWTVVLYATPGLALALLVFALAVYPFADRLLAMTAALMVGPGAWYLASRSPRRSPFASLVAVAHLVVIAGPPALALTTPCRGWTGAGECAGLSFRTVPVAIRNRALSDLFRESGGRGGPLRQSTKLVLDIVMGAVIPILILNRLTDPLGAPTAYVLAALVPVAWVLSDLLFITRTFNFITSVAGLAAVVNGVLAFWFVDGLLFAFKDSISEFLFAAILGGSVLVGRPVLAYIFAQVVGADTPGRRDALAKLLREPPVARALVFATSLVTFESLIVAVANFFLNLNIVVADFGTGAFNNQVARVNAITRVSFPILSVGTFFVAFYVIYRAVFRRLPTEDPAPAGDEFWRLLSEREARQDAP